MNERVRLVSWVIAVLFAAVVSAIAVGAAGCSSNNATPAGPGSGSAASSGAGSPTANRNMGGNGVGGAAGNNAGGAGGAAGGGAGGAGMTGAAGMGCPQPTGPVGTWVEIAPPGGQTDFAVTDAFAVGPNDILFAGNTPGPIFAVGPAEARVLRWTQGCWSVEVMIPPSVATPQFPSVHGTGPSDIWATGGDLLYHRDAQGWTRFADESWRTKVVPPPMFQPPLELDRVRAAAPNDVWVAATSNIMHWSGGQWTTYNFDTPGYPDASASVGFFFNDISIDAPNSVWVGGRTDQVGNTMELAYMHHFDGAAWTHVIAPGFSLDAIGRGGSVLWLAGATPTVMNGSTVFVPLARFDGTAAGSAGVPIAGVDLTQRSVSMTSVFGRGAGDVWAGGTDVAHFDGQSWTLPGDAPAAAHSDTDSRNTYVAGDAGSVWLATAGPHFFRKANGP